jgi:hypothetical protein
MARHLVRVVSMHPLLAWQRAQLALPHMSGNRAFARLHRNS